MATTNDKILNDLIRHKVMLLQYANNQAMQAVSRVISRDKDIKQAIFAALIEMDSNVWQPAYDSLLAGKLTPVMLDVFIEAISVINDEIPELVAHELTYLETVISKYMPEEIKPLAPVLSPTVSSTIRQVRNAPVMGVKISKFPQVLADSAVKLVTGQIKSKYNAGMSKAQIVDEITPLNSAFYSRQKANVSAVAKTVVGAAGSESRDAFMVKNSGIIKCRQWISTLDTHTTPMCITRDLKMYTVAKPVQPVGHSIPYGAGPGRLHYGCRSEENIVLKGIDEMGLSGDFSAATRASMGGQVPAGLKYSDWLAKQDDYTKERVLGVTRAALVKSGKMKIPQLYSDTGNMIPLKQLKISDGALP